MVVYVFDDIRVPQSEYTDRKYAHKGTYEIYELSNPCECCGCANVIEHCIKTSLHKESRRHTECSYCDFSYCTLEQQQHNRTQFLGKESNTSFSERGFETGE